MTKIKKHKKTLILIDSNALIHRAFHALPPLTTKDGTPSGAVYGVTLTLLSVLDKFKPDYMVATFDLKGPTFRHKKFKDYKANRIKAPDELYQQIPLVKKLMEALGIPIFEKKGFEADDIIGTISKNKKINGNVEKIIVTGDMDALQLVDNTTKVFTLRRGIKDTFIYDIQQVKNRFELSPDQIVDYKALRGDPSDNIPGVKGIGEKGAINLLKKYKTLENIYNNLNQIEPEGLKNKLMAGKESAMLSKNLAEIKTDVPIDFSLKKAVASKAKDSKELIKFLGAMGFKSLVKRVGGDVMEIETEDSRTKAQQISKKLKIKILKNKKEINALVKKIKSRKKFSYFVLTDKDKFYQAKLEGMGIYIGGSEAYFVINDHKIVTTNIDKTNITNDYGSFNNHKNVANDYSRSNNHKNVGNGYSRSEHIHNVNDYSRSLQSMNARGPSLQSMNARGPSLQSIDAIGSLLRIFMSKGIEKIGFNVKFDLEMMGNKKLSIKIVNLFLPSKRIIWQDVQIMAYLLGHNAGDLEKLIMKEFGADLSYVDNKEQGNLLAGTDESRQKDVAERAFWVMQLWKEYSKSMDGYKANTNVANEYSRSNNQKNVGNDYSRSRGYSRSNNDKNVGNDYSRSNGYSCSNNDKNVANDYSRSEDIHNVNDYSRSLQSMNARDHSLKMIYQELELPLIPILAQMEITGIKVNKKILKKVSDLATKEVKKLENKIYKLAGEKFNISSPKQLAVILYEKLKISTQGIKKGKTGFSTNADQLGKIEKLHPIVILIEEYREFTKLKNTYADALPKLVEDDERIHANFNQAVVATGRLSSSEPNLQNIPKRGKLASEIRKAFIAEKGKVLVSADYSQIDLRVAAHLSGDKKMIEIFKQGKDIHRATAAWVNQIAEDKVTDEQRSQAKSLNFGILYGMGLYGFMQDSGVNIKRAKFFINHYKKTFSGLMEFIEKIKEQAHQTGYVETELGRRRYIPNIKASNAMLRGMAERMAINLPVQGLAADIMKLAMIKVSNNILQEFNLKVNFKQDVSLVLQIHDELILETDKKLVNLITKKIKQEMESVYKLRVPLVVNVSQASNWQEL